MKKYAASLCRAQNQSKFIRQSWNQPYCRMKWDVHKHRSLNWRTCRFTWIFLNTTYVEQTYCRINSRSWRLPACLLHIVYIAHGAFIFWFAFSNVPSVSEWKRCQRVFHGENLSVYNIHVFAAYCPSDSFKPSWCWYTQLCSIVSRFSHHFEVSRTLGIWIWPDEGCDRKSIPPIALPCVTWQLIKFGLNTMVGGSLWFVALETASGSQFSSFQS